MNDSDTNQQQLEEQIQKAFDNMTPDEAKDVFVESMILEKYADNEDVDDEVFEELKRQLEDRLDIKINDKLLSALPSNKVDELDGIIDAGADSEKIRNMLSENGVDVDKLVADSMKELHDEYFNEDVNSEGE